MITARLSRLAFAAVVVFSASDLLAQSTPATTPKPAATAQPANVANPADASTTLTEQLVAVMLEKNLPAPMYEQGSNPWPGGDYKVQVFKAGRPAVASSPRNIHVKMPLKIVIAGNVASELLQIKMQCHTTFTTVGEITFTPTTPGVVETLASSITLPIPPVMADCDGTQFPVDDYLKSVVAQNKRQWELKLDAEMKSWLVGTPK